MDKFAWGVLSVACCVVFTTIFVSQVRENDSFLLQVEEAQKEADQAFADLKLNPSTQTVEKYVTAMSQRQLKAQAYDYKRNDWRAGPVVLAMLFSMFASIALLIIEPLREWSRRHPRPSGLA